MDKELLTHSAGMKVCFLHTEVSYPVEQIELQRALACRMVKSVKKHMKCEVVQLTDPITPPIVGIDRAARIDQRGKYWAEFIGELLSSQVGDVLFLDTDCVVQKDVSDIFKHEFDVALTIKTHGGAVYIDKTGKKHVMPWTGGVQFSRCPQFWVDNMKRAMSYEDDAIRGWWGGGVGFLEYMKVCPYKVLFLDREEFNYAPATPDEDVSTRAIVHYKGIRKTWNLEGDWQPLSPDRKQVVKFA